MDAPVTSATQTKFTCSTCRIWLTSVDEQRKHFQTPLHSFNVRRKVVGMVPVSQEQFDERMAALEEKEEETLLYQCTVCRKSFKSSEMLEQHFRSKKHLKAAKGVSNEEATATAVRKAKPAAGETLTVEERLEKQIEKGRRLGPLECCFCGELFKSPQQTVEHMAATHSFFVPDVEYLVDLEGLLSYLGDKVGVGFCCVYCHRPFDTLRGVRDHMRDLSHCKMVYEDDNDQEAGEFDDYYDFSSTYEEEALNALPKVHVSADGTQLVLGESGKSIGHRDMKRYYDQKLSGNASEQRLMIAQTQRHLMSRYKQLGWTGQRTALETVQARKEKQRANRAAQKIRYKTGMATEKVNEKYFRRRDLHW